MKRAPEFGEDATLGEGLSKLADSYDLVLCDVWGVVHNGTALYAEAVEALERFRNRGGFVILLSNASRLETKVNAQLETLGLTKTAYDRLITSGDLTREYIGGRPNCAIFDVGPGDSRPIFEGLDVQFTTPHDADLAVTSGAFTHAHDPVSRELKAILNDMISKDLMLLCANPDVITELGGRQVKCSGALAERYEALGGRVIYAGKPQAPIYEHALAFAQALRGGPVLRERILAIGDSLRTDIAGAAANGFDSLFTWGGIHERELGSNPTPDSLIELFTQHALIPTFTTHRLAW